MSFSKFRLGIVISALLFLLASCRKDEEKPVVPQFVFKHNVNGSPLQKGAMIYTNKAGNRYRIDELQYFISEIIVKTTDGNRYPITTDSGIHYIDIALPSTLTWKPKDRWPVTGYESIMITFGINEVKNKTGLYVNPPERDMFWPEMMGGGYHYMKMNGQWKSLGDTVKPFNFHLGVGMNEDGSTHYQNYFAVEFPLNIQAGSLNNVFTITMNIEKWFEDPYVWDWNVIGGQIMQNQYAMRKACGNGNYAFEISHKGEDIIYFP